MQLTAFKHAYPEGRPNQFSIFVFIKKSACDYDVNMLKF